PLALAAATLYLLARADLAGRDQESFTDHGLLPPLDPSAEEERRWGDRRWGAKRRGNPGRLGRRPTLAHGAARFRDMDAHLPEEARGWRPAGWTEEEWPYRQVLSFVQAELALHRGTPAQAEEWVTRLEAELREHLRPEAPSRLHRDREATG